MATPLCGSSKTPPGSLAAPEASGRWCQASRRLKYSKVGRAEPRGLRGLAHSKTWRDSPWPARARRVLDCGGPPPPASARDPYSSTKRSIRTKSVRAGIGNQRFCRLSARAGRAALPAPEQLTRNPVTASSACGFEPHFHNALIFRVFQRGWLAIADFLP